MFPECERECLLGDNCREICHYHYKALMEATQAAWTLYERNSAYLLNLRGGHDFAAKLKALKDVELRIYGQQAD